MALKKAKAIVRTRDNQLYAVIPAGLASWLHTGAEVDITSRDGQLVVRPVHGSRRPKREQAGTSGQNRRLLEVKASPLIFWR